MRGKSAAVGVSNCLPFLFGTIAPRIFLLLSSKQALMSTSSSMIDRVTFKNTKQRDASLQGSRRDARLKSLRLLGALTRTLWFFFLPTTGMATVWMRFA